MKSVYICSMLPGLVAASALAGDGLDYNVPSIVGFPGLFEQLESHDYALVRFTPKSCDLCEKVNESYEPIREAISREYPGQVAIVDVDVDVPENEDMCKCYGVSSVPHFKLFNAGVVNEARLPIAADFCVDKELEDSVDPESGSQPFGKALSEKMLDLIQDLTEPCLKEVEADHVVDCAEDELIFVFEGTDIESAKKLSVNFRQLLAKEVYFVKTEGAQKLSCYKGIDEEVVYGEADWSNIEAATEWALQNRIPKFGKLSFANQMRYESACSKGMLWVCFDPASQSEDVFKYREALHAAAATLPYPFVYVDATEFGDYVTEEIRCSQKSYPELIFQKGDVLNHEPAETLHYRRNFNEEELTEKSIEQFFIDVMSGEHKSLEEEEGKDGKFEVRVASGAEGFEELDYVVQQNEYTLVLFSKVDCACCEKLQTAFSSVAFDFAHPSARIGFASVDMNNAQNAEFAETKFHVMPHRGLKLLRRNCTSAAGDYIYKDVFPESDNGSAREIHAFLEAEMLPCLLHKTEDELESVYDKRDPSKPFYVFQGKDQKLAAAVAQSFKFLNGASTYYFPLAGTEEEGAEEGILMLKGVAEVEQYEGEMTEEKILAWNRASRVPKFGLLTQENQLQWMDVAKKGIFWVLFDPSNFAEQARDYSEVFANAESAYPFVYMDIKQNETYVRESILASGEYPELVLETGDVLGLSDEASTKHYRRSFQHTKLDAEALKQFFADVESGALPCMEDEQKEEEEPVVVEPPQEEAESSSGKAKKDPMADMMNMLGGGGLGDLLGGAGGGDGQNMDQMMQMLMGMMGGGAGGSPDLASMLGGLGGLDSGASEDSQPASDEL